MVKLLIMRLFSGPKFNFVTVELSYSIKFSCRKAQFSGVVFSLPLFVTNFFACNGTIINRVFGVKLWVFLAALGDWLVACPDDCLSEDLHFDLVSVFEVSLLELFGDETTVE